MHEKRKKTGVLQTVVFADRALEAKNAQVPSGKQNFDGRLKPKKGEPNGQKSDKCQKDGPLIFHFGHSKLQKVDL